MRRFILIALAAIVIAVLVLVGIGLWSANQTFDMSNPKYAGMFEENYMKICLPQIKKSVAAKNVAIAEEAAIQICTCGAEESLAHFKDRTDIKVMDIMTNEKYVQELNGIMEACAKKLGSQ